MDEIYFTTRIDGAVLRIEWIRLKIAVKAKTMIRHESSPDTFMPKTREIVLAAKLMKSGNKRYATR